MSFFGDWPSGGTMTYFFFMQKGKTGIAKLNGEITVNGNPVDGDGMGIYSDFSTMDLSSSKKITVKSALG